MKIFLYQRGSVCLLFRTSNELRDGVDARNSYISKLSFFASVLLKERKGKKIASRNCISGCVLKF